MGQLCCAGTSKQAQAVSETSRPERTLEVLMKKEGAMVKKTIRQLCNVVPGLLKYLANDKETESTPGCELMPFVISTLRHALVSYSKAYSGDASWFTMSLSNKESMAVLHAYVAQHKKGLLKVFTKPCERDVAAHFVREFTGVWEQLQGAGLDVAKQIMATPYWKNTAMLCDFFMQADEDAGGDLEVGEIEEIMHKQNIGLEGARLRRLIERQDTSGDSKLDFGEYISFYMKITEKRFIEQILFNDYKQGPPRRIMTAEEFHDFLTSAQGACHDLAQTKKILKRLKARGIGTSYEEDGRSHLGITARHFADYLTLFPADADEERQWDASCEPHNSCYESRYTTRIYQDMLQPMGDYFIASSHNTYLDHGQLTGQSSTTAYMNALLLGCRCVEIDCWDGPDGEPIVYHGHTLTTKVKFIDVIKAIDKYAFKKSQYPVILSLEIHTSADQQARMGQIMKNIFRRRVDGTNHVSILQPPIAFTDHKKTYHDFTPDGLRGKILVKGKIVSTENMELFKEHCRLVSLMLKQTNTYAERLEMDMTKGADDIAERDEDDKGSSANLFESTASLRTDAQLTATAGSKKTTRHESPKTKKVTISPGLSSCVWMKSVQFRGFEGTALKGNHWDVSSFTENTFEKLSATPQLKEDLVQTNKTVFSRIYPGAKRVTSDNFHPQPCWNTGCQIVALNYQIEHNRSHELRYNLARFQDNGRCGYLLKPPPLRLNDGRSAADYNDGLTLTVEVIQAFQLPKPNNESRGEKIDPYVMLWMNGVDADRSEQYRTKVIDDNGWNPEFFSTTTNNTDSLTRKQLSRPLPLNANGGNIFRFSVSCTEMAMLTLQVWDEDVGVEDDFIGEAVIPMNILRPGYRAVPLKSDRFVQMPSLLFCRFTVDVAQKKA
eukprot:Rhum_TRINITY_DN18676_c0_g1::Rhum_TRINITY_DN18676_c0_g1_i1::g.168078::m.168078/K05857/PLCD; phosphatidylinositol phospholipase C, delta